MTIVRVNDKKMSSIQQAHSFSWTEHAGWYAGLI